MKIKTQLKAGGYSLNHNDALHLRSGLQAGGWTQNHHETLKVRTNLTAGITCRKAGGDPQ